MKNQEIEVKFKYRNKQDVIKLIKKDFEFVKKTCIHDKYFSPDKIDMSDSNSLIRLRTTDNHSEITYKEKIAAKNNITHRLELCTVIQDPNTMEQIILKLGSRFIKENFSTREIWSGAGTEIVFIDYSKPAKLHFLEIEGESEKLINNVIDKISSTGDVVGEEIFKIFDNYTVVWE